MVSKSVFGKLPGGEEAVLVHLENKSGAYADILQYGAVVVKLGVSDKDGKLRDVVLGYDKIEQYEVNGCFFGACIGRNGNRIADGKFTLDGKEYTIAQNDNENNLHSGPVGFEKRLWEIRKTSDEENSVTFGRISPDGESGFPGNFDVNVTYTMTEDNSLHITYDGVCDQTGVANMTNHSYFNLNGEGSGTAMDHYLTIDADVYTPVRAGAIPLGRFDSVDGTPFDFRTPKQIGRDIEQDNEQLKLTGGFDHNLDPNGYDGKTIRKIAEAWSEESGIHMEVLTDLPAVQFYAGNWVQGEHGKNGHIYEPRTAFCLETQAEPNAVNEPSFHQPIYKAGERYHSETIYHFFTKD